MGNKKTCEVHQQFLKGDLKFPDLREITDFVTLYQTKDITTMRTLFPNVTVIRGNRLIKVQTLRQHEIETEL